jgi:hypothetical protein
LLDCGQPFGMRSGARVLHERVELGSFSLAAGSRFENLSAQLLEVAQNRVLVKWLRFLRVQVGHDIVERDETLRSS